MKLIVRIAVTAVAIWVAATYFPGAPGIVVATGATSPWIVYAVLAVILGLVNAFIKPIVKIFTFPITILTLGLFLLVINALMLMLASKIAQWAGYGFTVNGFVPAVLGSIVISIVGGLLYGLLGGDDKGDRRQ